METDPKEGLEERMARLERELDNATDGGKQASVPGEQDRKSYSQAMKISSEFIAAVIVGAILGYLLDTFLGSRPWGMIVFLLLGFCAGILNVLRVVGVVKSPHPVDRIGTDRRDDNKR